MLRTCCVRAVYVLLLHIDYQYLNLHADVILFQITPHLIRMHRMTTAQVTTMTKTGNNVTGTEDQIEGVLKVMQITFTDGHLIVTPP